METVRKPTILERVYFSLSGMLGFRKEGVIPLKPATEDTGPAKSQADFQPEQVTAVSVEKEFDLSAHIALALQAVEFLNKKGVSLTQVAAIYFVFSNAKIRSAFPDFGDAVIYVRDFLKYICIKNIAIAGFESIVGLESLEKFRTSYQQNVADIQEIQTALETRFKRVSKIVNYCSNKASNPIPIKSIQSDSINSQEQEYDLILGTFIDSVLESTQLAPKEQEILRAILTKFGQVGQLSIDELERKIQFWNETTILVYSLGEYSEMRIIDAIRYYIDRLHEGKNFGSLQIALILLYQIHENGRNLNLINAQSIAPALHCYIFPQAQMRLIVKPENHDRVFCNVGLAADGRLILSMRAKGRSKSTQDEVTI